MTGTMLFNYFEAREKLGLLVRVKNDFRDIPRGTNGRIVRAEPVLGAFCVAITWDDLQGRIVTDIVNKYEYDKHIEEMK